MVDRIVVDGIEVDRTEAEGIEVDCPKLSQAQSPSQWKGKVVVRVHCSSQHPKDY